MHGPEAAACPDRQVTRAYPWPERQGSRGEGVATVPRDQPCPARTPQPEFHPNALAHAAPSWTAPATAPHQYFFVLLQPSPLVKGTGKDTAGQPIAMETAASFRWSHSLFAGTLKAISGLALGPASGLLELRVISPPFFRGGP